MVSTAVKITVSLAWTYACFVVIAPMILREAYEVRLEAINEYGEYNHPSRSSDNRNQVKSTGD
jgi:hypothetical protein|eukprot:scaffold8922_cov287-Chaetoceros_neogracile.AAC.9